MRLYPVILAGGGGSRLWPLSRSNEPKQFLDPMEQGESLLQSTIARAKACSSHAPLIIANKQHRFVLSQQASLSGVANSQILLEPVARNTAASVLLAALHVIEQDEAACLLILPADHYLPEYHEFSAAISQFDSANRSQIGLLAIEATSANINYGYMQLMPEANSRVVDVVGFVEKPSQATADQYLADGNYFWNSGIVIASAALLIAHFKALAADLYECVLSAYQERSDFFGFIQIGADFEKAVSQAFDVTILERVPQLVAIKYRGRWDDLGSWPQLLNRRKEAMLSRVISRTGKLALIVGLDDVLVVDDDDVLLIASQDSVAGLSDAAGLLARHGCLDLLSRLDVHRPWGRFKVMAKGDGFLVKHLFVYPNSQISLQSHQGRIEHWVVIKGVASVRLDGAESELMVGEAVTINKTQKHRLKNKQQIPLEIIEVQVGQLLIEADIVRYDDDYERHLES